MLDLKAFQIALPLYRNAQTHLGDEHAAVAALRSTLVLLTQGCHRFSHDDKAAAYRAARDAASLAVCELVLGDHAAAEPGYQLDLEEGYLRRGT